MTTLKTCNRCMSTLPIASFGKNTGMADGYLGQCKSCRKIALRIYRDRNRATIRAQQHKWESQEPVRKRAAIRLKKWAEEHPLRKTASTIVNNAIRDGRLFRQPCFICGKTAHAHHPDYDRPMDVVWLCGPHHMQAHALVERTV